MVRFRSVLALTVLVLVVPAFGDETYRQRRRALERDFAEKYMAIAVPAKKAKAADLTREAFDRAQDLDPGNDDVIDFDPAVSGRVKSLSKRRVSKLRERLAKHRREEAEQRLSLALWCGAQGLSDEAALEASIALSLVPGPVTFDMASVLSEPTLGTLPRSLSLTLLEEHEVFGGRLMPTSELPGKVSWKEAWTLTTEHYLLKTNVSGHMVREAARALEAAREIYAEETGLSVEAPIAVHIVATRDEYEALWKARGRPAPDEMNIGKCHGDFCGVDGSKRMSQVLSTAIHEVAHGYLNLGLEKLTGKPGATMPAWYHEGLATYCAGYGPDSLSYDDGVVLPRIARDFPLRRFRKMVEGGRAMPLGEFLTTEDGDGDFYHQAYAFYWFLRETDPDLRRRFDRAVKKLYRAKLTDDRTTRGNELFLDAIGFDAKEIENRFFAWVQSGEERDS